MVTTLSSISFSSTLVISGSSVNFEMNLAVSSGVSWNFGSSMRWMRVEEYSATSTRTLRSLGVNWPPVPAARLLVEHLDRPDDDVGLQRDGEHRIHLEADLHLLERGGVGTLAAEKERLAGLDDLADVAGAGGQFQGEQLALGFLELGFLGLVRAPQRGRVVDLLERDFAAFHQI